LNNNTQALSIVSAETDNGSIKAEFDRFELGSLSQIIETDTQFIRGVMDGFVEFRNLKTTPAFVSDLTIKNAAFQQTPIGDIALKADNLTASKYMAQLTLTGNKNDVHVIGSYTAAGATNALDFKVDIAKLNLSTIEPFTAGQLRRTKGYITGNLKVTGKATQPVIVGDVYFKDAGFNLAYINNYLRLKDEHIAIDGKGVYFRQFTILDSLGQKATVAGAVYTSDFRKMRFDANVTTNNFTVMNTTIKDNALFFGHVLLNSDISIKGTEVLPIVDVDAKLLDGTNISVVLPSAKISTDRGEGVVMLIDSEQVITNDVNVDSLMIGQLKGIKLKANLEITPRTTLKLIVDKSSGDSLVIRGEGRLSFAMNESGNQNLTGTYYINSGAYKATFQKVVKRQLTIAPGGYITFNGNPTDALVDITAVYTVKTPPADLLSTELASSTSGERNVYKKPIIFKVLMRMKGELLKPEISFKLDMNEADQNAFGGTVYSKINSLNNDPSELNKQVFALIILNKFIPAGIGTAGEGDGYATAATNMARNSLNQVLTDQLNALSGKYIKWIDLSVGINSNDEYTTAGVNQGTQVSVGLKKSFFKERLTVQVGTSVNVQNSNGEVKGTDANSLTGDIVVEYKINADGSLRFKAFRENQYEGLIDGSLYKTGVGIVISKDYDSEKEIFRKKTAEEKAAEKEQELRDKEEAAAAKAERIKARA
ncbi:MAG TPA: translocation/assembly module TamB domain-containing protein, partial [Chitinophagales bacterium]|nr:translocation/assembly module TamB domain-containing protein [Chitinophagales bacterium]